MIKHIRKISILICLSSILYGCGKIDSAEENTNTSTNELQMVYFTDLGSYRIEDLNKDIQEVNIGNRFNLSLSTIGNDGSILLGNVPRDESEYSIIYLFNVEDGSDIELDRVKATKHFGFAYQDDEMIVYFTYPVWGVSAIPIEYYIYYKDTQQKETMKLSESVEVHKELMIDRRMVRIDDELYFEVQDREPTFKENEDVYDDNGASIYKYNLNTKEISFVTRGMSPRVYKDELIYINNNQVAEIVTMDGEVITDSVIDYYTYDDMIIAVRYVDEICWYVLLKDGEEKVLFTRYNYGRFWSISTNGKYITWQQSAKDLCFYDIEKDSLVQIDPTAGGMTVVSENYLYWSENLNPDEKFNVELVIKYIKFD